MALPAAQLTPEPASQLLVPAPSPSATARPPPSQNAHQTVSGLPSGRSPAMASQSPIANGAPIVVHDEPSTPMDLSSALPSVPSAPRGSQKRPSEQSAPDSSSANSGSQGFRGFTQRKKSNAIAVWLLTLAAAERSQTHQRLSITSEVTVPVQVYLVEGSDLERCVVYNVDVGEDQIALPRELLIGNVASYFGGGSGTMRSALEWLLLMSAAKPDLQGLVRTEIDAVIERKEPNGSNRVSWTDRSRMPYTQAFIWEVMRFKPVHPLSPMRRNPTVCVHLTAGTTYFFLLHMHSFGLCCVARMKPIYKAQIVSEYDIILHALPIAASTSSFIFLLLLFCLYQLTDRIFLCHSRSTSANINLGGYFVPRGSIVISSFWSVFHEASFWGDPEVFRPERFLSDDGKSAKKPERLIPFSYGKRSCAGESIAVMVVFIFFTNILRHFSVEAPYDSAAALKDEVLGIAMRPAPRDLVFRPRA
nr:uncharacterized protein LOC129381921 [Dermacentor andersoni]